MSITREVGYGLIAGTLGVTGVMITHTQLRKLLPFGGYLREIGIKQWGPGVGGVISTLVTKGLIDWLRPKEIPGDPSQQEKETLLSQLKADKAKMAELLKERFATSWKDEWAVLPIGDQFLKIEELLKQKQECPHKNLSLGEDLKLLNTMESVNEKVKQVIQEDQGSFEKNVVALLGHYRLQLALLSPLKKGVQDEMN